MNKVIYVYNEDIDLDIKENMEIYHLVTDKSVNVKLNLNNRGIEVNYYLSVINEQDNIASVYISHEASDTKSMVVCHGVNVLDKKLEFDINGKAINEASNCVCSQENQIINLQNGKGIIRPNLLIRNYDTVSNHSAYIGAFKENDLFYLMSRGINEKKAEELLMESLLLGNFKRDEKIVEEFYLKLGEITNG